MFCTKCGFNLYSGDAFCTNCGSRINYSSSPISHPSSINIEVTTTSEFDSILSFLKKNYLFFVALAVAAILLIGSYFLFVFKYPQREAQKIIKIKCDCHEKFSKKMISELTTFSNDLLLNSKQFNSRRVAYDNLENIQGPIWQERNYCLEKVDSLIQINRLHWKNDEQKFTEFIKLIEKDTTENKYVRSVEVIEQKISSQIEKIKSSKPDADMLKNYIVGSKIMNQEIFVSSQIKSLTVISQNEYDNELRYTLNLVAKYEDTHEPEFNFNNVTVKFYLNNEGNWVLSNIDCLNMTMTFWVVNVWYKVQLPENSSYNFISDGRKAWVKDNSWFASNQKIGPDVSNNVSLNGSTIYFASREPNGERIQITLNVTKNY